MWDTDDGSWCGRHAFAGSHSQEPRRVVLKGYTGCVQGATFWSCTKNFFGDTEKFWDTEQFWDAKCFFWDSIFLETQVFG